MKRTTVAALVLLFCSILVAALIVKPAEAGAQISREQAASSPSATSPGAPPAQSAARPGQQSAQQAGRAAGAEEEQVKYKLDCAGCHGAGQTLPYLTGEQRWLKAHGSQSCAHAIC